MTKEMEDKWDSINKLFPSYELTDGIGYDSDTAYVLDLTTEENFNIANEYLSEACRESYKPIDKRYIGEKVLIEYIFSGGRDCDWYCMHGTPEEYFEKAKKGFLECLKRTEK